MQICLILVGTKKGTLTIQPPCTQDTRCTQIAPKMKKALTAETVSA